MDQSLSIGEFARLTHLPVKTLRHYHQVGVRERYLVSPADSPDPLDWRTEVCWPVA